MRPVGRALAVVLSAAGVSCSDGVAPGPFEGIPLSFSLEAPAAVSPAETSALQGAFDLVDTYHVFVQDSASGGSLGGDTVSVASGQTLHAIDLSLPSSTLGLAVLVTVIGFDGTQELYRTTAYVRVQDTDSTPLALAVRYTGPGVRGRLTSSAGAALANVEVDLVQITGGIQRDSVTTEADGTYLFVGVSTGTYEVQPTPPAQQFVCPAVRQVNVATATTSIVADFAARATACQVDLLIVSGGDLAFADDTATVKAFFAGVPTINTRAFFFVNTLPGLTVLRQYDVVLVFSNGLFNQSAALGNQIEAYVQLGGNVITATFYWQNRSDSGLGSTGWGRLEAVDPFTSGPGQTYQSASLQTSPLPVTHQLTDSLFTLTSTGFRGAVAAKTGTSVVARWNDNSPLVGYQVLPGGSRMVAVSLFPASGTAATGNVGQLFRNAVRWAGAAGGPIP